MGVSLRGEVRPGQGNRGIRALAKALEYNMRLQTLNLRWNYVTAAGAVALAEGLRKNKTLRLLDIEENSIGKRGAVAIAGSLLAGGNTSLTSLSIGGDIHEFGNSAIAAVGPVGAGALADALKVENCQLVSLNLDETRIGADGATALAEGLLANNSLTYLSLSAGREYDVIRTTRPENKQLLARRKARHFRQNDR